MTPGVTDLLAAGPPVVVALTAVVVLLGTVLPKRPRPPIGPTLGGLTVAAAWVAAQAWAPLGRQTREAFCVGVADGDGALCSYSAGDLTLVLQALMLAGAVVVVLMSAAAVPEQRLPAGEFHVLLLCSVCGALTLAAGGDLITLLVALELVSLPGFALVGLRRHDARAGEAALTFFLVSVVSAAVTLFGISLVYGATGAVHLETVRAGLATAGTAAPLAALGVVLTVVGFAFKVAAVPFHFWAPDTYAGAPLPVAAYLAVVSKAAGFVGLVLLLVVAFRPFASLWGPLVAVLAALTMTVGNLVALRQREAVRLLAWSSVAHAGYMLVPLSVAASASGRAGALDDAVGATVVYLVVYAAMNLGAFAVAIAVSRRRPANLLSDYRGLARRAPLQAAALAFFLAALAGLPPGLAGLFAKIVVFRAALDGGVAWLALVMAVNTVVALAYYLTWGAQLFLADAHPEEAGLSPASAAAPRPLTVALGCALAATVALSVLPQLVLQVIPGISAGLG
ncbi:MAG: NADH-quinone oxidoreductase subunit N [Actinomycetota bacterium]|nr:NADH-quinone oxidoreductase subunit N [Actinomycetota bacterium]